ncbi:hypothetical protein ACQ4PT_020100 [Festuca glaucescens]
MPPRRASPLGSTSFRGVRARPSGNYATDIQAAGMWVWIGTFLTPHEAARAYAAAWRFGHSCGWLNFPKIKSREEAEMLTPPPLLVTREDQLRYRRALKRLVITEADERAMAEWRCNPPEDVEEEKAFWHEKKAERKRERDEKKRKKAEIQAELDGLSTLDEKDDWWFDLLLTSEESSDESDDED